MKKETLYNPLDKANLGVSVADEVVKRDAMSLPPEQFFGAGIYVIYYAGDFAAYAPLANKNRDPDHPWSAPIYVGKAVPAGARKGGKSFDASTGLSLWKRLSKHAETIKQTRLKLEDFRCRYLVVDDVWIPLGESMLIEMFQPIWNLVLDGFGNNDPGGRRYTQLRSPWDTVHPGRSWAAKCADPKKTAAEYIAAIEAFLRK